MKRPGLTRPLVSATLFLILSVAPTLPAQDAMATSAAAKSTKRADELLKRFDKNGDGKLDDDERADAKELMMTDQVERQMARANALPGGLEQFRAEALQLFDKNRDGRLDEDERNAAQKFAAEAEDLKKRFDRNGDGALDAEERAKSESFLLALRAVGGGQTRFELIRRFDLNSDGTIDEREFSDLEKFVRPRVEASVEQLRRHDTNGDGSLDDAEWSKAKSVIASWLNTPPSIPGNPTPEMEQRRLDAVAKEVARRRALREAAAKKTGVPPN